MLHIGSDFYFDRGGLKKADALQMFWLFAVAVAVPAVAVLAVPVPTCCTCSPAVHGITYTTCCAAAAAALLNIIAIISG